jgi:hypothetical protein
MRCATNSGADRDLLTAISRQLQRAEDKQSACCNRRALLRARTRVRCDRDGAGHQAGQRRPFSLSRPYLICSRFLSVLAPRPLSSPPAVTPTGMVSHC